MRSTTVGMALMGSVVAAQSSVTSLWLPGFDSQPLVASVIGGDASATTYFIECAPGTDPTDCGVGTGFTLTEGPKTVHLQMTMGASSILFADLQCDIDTASSLAACTETIGGSEADYPGVTATTLASTDFASGWMPVTITAGSVSGAPATTAASATAPTASATGTSSGTASAATTAATSSSASSSSSASTTGSSVTSSGLSTAASSATTSDSASAKPSVVSTGGMPQITGNAQWAMGGVAVAMALAAF